MNRKVIALTIHSLQAGGMENVMAKLANYFSITYDADIHLVIFGKSSEIFYEINSKVIIHKPIKRFIERPRFIGTISRVFYLRRNILAIDPSSVLSFGVPWNSFVLLALLGTKYPVFISDRGSPQRQYSKLSELMRKLFYRYAKGIIAQTDVAAEMLKRIFPHPNIKVIGNPVEILPNHHKEKENIILSVGRLIATKHHDRLISIFSRLNAPGWKLVIVGGDALKERNETRLRKIIEENGLSDRVIIAGEVKNVREYYLKSRIFAFTSSVEGFPNVIAEALSAGLPVVSYDCVAGPSEMIIDGKNGYLVPVFKDDLFLAKLQILVKDNLVLKSLSGNATKLVRRFYINNIGKEFYSFILDEN